MAQASEAAVSAVAAKLQARRADQNKPAAPEDAAASTPEKTPRKANRKVATPAQPVSVGSAMIEVSDELASEITGVVTGDMVNAKPRKAD